MVKSIGCRARRAVLGIAIALLAGCEWAPLTREGEGVTVARPEHVAREVDAHGLQVRQVIAHPAEATLLTTAWYYYACVKVQ